MPFATPPILLLLCVCMFLGSYFAGLVPLLALASSRFGSNESKLRIFTVFGAGLLVGTALAVIIPEGVQAIYEERTWDFPLVPQSLNLNLPTAESHGPSAHAHEHPLPAASDPGTQPAADLSSLAEHPVSKREDAMAAGPIGQEKMSAPSRESSDNSKVNVSAAGRVKRDVVQQGDESEHRHDGDSGFLPQRPRGPEHGSHATASVDWQIGVALVSGFVFMLIIDQCSRCGRSPSIHLPGSQSSSSASRSQAATLGLLVHSAADGVALGAASSGGQGGAAEGLQIIVFAAIMLHKAPAAFGLSSFLLFEGVERWRVRRHLLAFSLAAPSAALLTVAAVAQGSGPSSGHSTGLAMLFSAGTFLYVATVHVLAEVTAGAARQQPDANAGAQTGLHRHSHHGGSLKPVELLFLILGALAPCVLSIGHSHGGHSHQS